MISRSGMKLSWDALLDLLRRWDESALVQRLGYLLDLHQVALPAKRRTALESLIRPGSKVHLGARRKWGTFGRLVLPWNIVENVPRGTLVEKGERPRRRVTLGKRKSFTHDR